MDESTARELELALTQATGAHARYTRAELQAHAGRVVELIGRAIDEAVEQHREDAPHIYRDGSTY